MQVDINFTPKKIGDHTGELVVHYETGLCSWHFADTHRRSFMIVDLHMCLDVYVHTYIQ